jgi:uncharacterized membrane protein YvlD (DUF360 family)
MLLLVSGVLPGFSIASFGTAILAAILLWIVSMVLNSLVSSFEGRTGK